MDFGTVEICRAITLAARIFQHERRRLVGLRSNGVEEIHLLAMAHFQPHAPIFVFAFVDAGGKSLCLQFGGNLGQGRPHTVLQEGLHFHLLGLVHQGA